MFSFLVLPPVLVTLGTIFGGVIVGFFYTMGIVGKNKSDNIVIAKKASEFVIETLEKKIKILEDNQNEMSSRLDSIQIENKTLRDVLQGRDGNTELFQRLGMEALTKTMPVMIQTVQRTDSNLNKLIVLLEKHLYAIENMQGAVITTKVETVSPGVK